MGTLRRHYNIRKYITTKLRFPYAKKFSENYPQFEKGPSKIFVSPVQDRKRIKNIGLKGSQVIKNVSYLVVVTLTTYSVFSSCVPPTTYKIFGFLLNRILPKMLTISSCLQRQTSCISQLKRKILGVSVSGLTSSDPAIITLAVRAL